MTDGPSEQEIEEARKRIEKAQRFAERGGSKLTKLECERAGRWLIKGPKENRRARRARKV